MVDFHEQAVDDATYDAVVRAVEHSMMADVCVEVAPRPFFNISDLDEDGLKRRFAKALYAKATGKLPTSLAAIRGSVFHSVCVPVVAKAIGVNSVQSCYRSVHLVGIDINSKVDLEVIGDESIAVYEFKSTESHRYITKEKASRQAWLYALFHCIMGHGMENPVRSVATYVVLMDGYGKVRMYSSGVCDVGYSSVNVEVVAGMIKDSMMRAALDVLRIRSGHISAFELFGGLMHSCSMCKSDESEIIGRLIDVAKGMEPEMLASLKVFYLRHPYQGCFI
jgi:hypothetical protein